MSREPSSHWSLTSSAVPPKWVKLTGLSTEDYANSLSWSDESLFRLSRPRISYDAMNTEKAERFWNRLSLPRQFILAGSVVMFVAMILVGSWVSKRIEQAAVQNFAIIAANYVESFIAPITQDLAEGDTLSPPAKQAMIEVFSTTALNERIVSYKIWKEGGLIVHASDPSLIGKVFEPSEDLQAAWTGKYAASLVNHVDAEDASEASLGISLLEVYSPIHEVFSGRIIAVAEFYERADPLVAELRSARRNSWLVVGSAFLASGLLLAGIVQAGGRTIQEQRLRLQAQLAQSEHLAEQNIALRRKAITANLRATAQLEQTIRHVGSDLHDGPAQHLSLAALRLDSAFDKNAGPNARGEIRASIDRALEEIRAISRGLALPELEQMDLASLVRAAISEREVQSGIDVNVTFSGSEPKHLSYTEKLCVYRFLQEGLSNAVRHGGVKSAEVRVEADTKIIEISIHDDGSGFVMETVPGLHATGGQGLTGLRDRAESIGGSILVSSNPRSGTTLTLTLLREQYNGNPTNPRR